MVYFLSVVLGAIFTFCSLPFVKLYQLKGYNAKSFISNIYAVKFSLSGKNFINLTKRLCRFLVIFFIVEILIWIIILKNVHIFWLISLVFLINLFILPLIMLIVHYLLFPFECLIKKYYIKKTIKKLQGFRGVKIAITGSFGKTSTKNVLKELLSTKYKVVATPLNYNTPMGLCKTVLENLKKDTQVLIVEMGARHKGDIKELCDMLKPDIGILTSVGEQHIETFGSLDVVKETKFELCESLSSNSKCYFDCYSENTHALYDKAVCKRVGLGKDVDLKIHKADGEGLLFETNCNGKSIKFKTRLLGRFMARNIALCSLVAKDLGVSESEMQKVVKNLKPSPHRLELISRGELNVLDDAYNSNYEGFCEALYILGLFDGEKVIVSPGMVELGERQYELNFKVGKLIGATCDKAIIMNKTNKKALKNGILSVNFNKKKLFFAENRNELNEILKKELSQKATILFENDLPDDYM